MIHYWKQKAAQYAIAYKGKEYVFYVRGDGTAVCAALQDAWNVISQPSQDRLVAFLAALAIPSEHRRAASIEEEFSCDVLLPRTVSRRVWRIWTLAKATGIKESPDVQCEMRWLGEWLDQALQPILEANILD